ncbi:MAG: beta-Ala-His dipeptidase [Clostridia bacterium]|nr:beta-Ala-His dipeptidase [Clostridia bacterium]
MPNVINAYVSELPARFFEEISAIPRVSYHEEGIADYLVEFATARGLAVYRDASHNVLIKKQGTVGRENEQPLLLQAHTDMVAELAFGAIHNFETEGLELQRKGNILSAKGTTLGADDGFGVALMLAALESAESHPPLECLFTAAEEVGLVGATAFDYGRISATRMINFDSAEEHLVITGCCGGVRTGITVPVCFEDIKAQGIEIALHGLCGGHSGEDIHRGRANALCVMGAILKKLRKLTPFRVVSMHGGDKDNAIPRDCVAVVVPDDMGAAVDFFSNSEALLQALVTSPDDSKRSLDVRAITVEQALPHTDTEWLLKVLGVRNGVLQTRADGSPQTSRNLARVRFLADKVDFAFSSRSPDEKCLNECKEELEALASSIGGSVSHHGQYPGWESEADSPVSLLWQSCYRAVTGREISSTVIHAGLESGLISARISGLDVIAVGCNIYDLHTPAERMELDSFERIYQTLLAFLKKC